jgi:uncharacterized delta-60 repeat protein
MPVGSAMWKGNALSGPFALIDATGTFDPAFDSNIGTAQDAGIESIAIQADEKVVIVGEFANWNGTPASGIVRLNTDGTLDTTFVTNTGTGFSFGTGFPPPFKVLIQSDQKILVAGGFAEFNGSGGGPVDYNKLIRLNTDGTIDTSFNAACETGGTKYIQNMALKANGEIVVTMSDTMTLRGKTRARIALLRPDGSCIGPA